MDLRAKLEKFSREKLMLVLGVYILCQPLIDVLYEYNAPLWEKAGYTPPPKPGALKKTVYAAADQKEE